MKILSPQGYTMIVVLFLLSSSISGQRENKIKRFYSIDYMREVSLEDESYRKRELEIEKHYRTFAKFGQDTTFMLPIVFHVSTHPLATKVTEEDVQSQVQVLNEDFGNLGSEDSRQSYYSDLAVDTRIRFCHIESKFAEGLHAANLHAKAWKELNKFKSKKNGGSDPIDPETTINVWVLNLPDSLTGFAQLPGASLENDGIIIDSDFFQKSDSMQSRQHTLTHLIGNYLGLLPLWGGQRCEDDKVDDTPIHNAPNYFKRTGNHVSTCDGYPRAMTENFMDSSPDSDSYMFTEGQKRRMHAMLDTLGPRGQLGSAISICEQQGLISLRNTDELNSVFRIYPNPASGILNIDFLQPKLPKEVQLYIFDLKGKLIQKHELNNISNRINLDRLEKGIYFFNVTIDQKSYTKKIVIL